MAMDPDFSHEADWLPGLPLPREQSALIGHDGAAEALHQAYRSGRMHHAWLLTGPKGIGKATLAFRFARFLLSYPDAASAPEPGPLLPADPRVTAQVATGAHPNILHLRRPYDDKDKKLKTVVTVEEVRRSVSFFGTSAGGAGYRIAIVDAADDMNNAAANALLKMLEEPPARAMFLLVSHAPGRLLPTIRSRCRRLPMEALTADRLDEALTALGLNVEEADKPALAAVSEGSVRRAIECIETDGLELYRGFRKLADLLPRLDTAALFRFAGEIAGRKGGDSLPLLADLARSFLSEQMRMRARQGPAASFAFADAWERIDRTLVETDGLNLDRKQAVIALMRDLSTAMKTAG